MIKQSSLESLKAQIDIVDILGNYLELKKAGANLKACCPFHSETTPSFVVSPQKQIYNCFGGCGSGDAIKFVQEYKKLTFVEAVEEIANDMNFTLEYDNNANKKDYSKLMEYINSYYISKLDKDTNAYLFARGVNDASIKTFEIGFAPNSVKQLDAINSELYTIQEAVECGIVAKDEDKKHYARVTKRISFPIRNHTGKLIGFGGRILDGDTRGAKYINSPQTQLFDKSRNFYGYNIAKEHIYKKGTFTIVEGYLDVVMFHQAGIKTAVATMGTALTELHCNIIKKAQGRALLCFDGDKAGISAAFKASKLLAIHNIVGGVVIFPTGKDPADMVKDGKSDELFNFMKRSTPLIKFAISHIASNYNLNIPNQKKDALIEILEFVKKLDLIIQDEYKTYIAKILSINPNHIILNKEQMQPVPQQQMQFINISEMNIIKTANESDELFNLVVETIEPNMLEIHTNELQMLLNKDPQIQGLLLRDELKAYTQEELKGQLNIILISHHTKELQIIINSNDSFDKKAFDVRRVKGIIFDLKRDIL